MGEKEGKKEGGGEKMGGGGGGGGAPTSVVLKLDIHCEGCALKIKKAVKNFEGVDAVSTDLAGNKLTVIGKVDPAKIREQVEAKTRKKVDLISPAGGGAPKKEAQPEAKEQKKEDEKKPKPPAASTVVLKIRLHCDGCIQRIRKTILRIKGVETVNIDAQKDLVTVKGTMDAGALPSYLKDKLKRSVEVVPQKKEGGGEKDKEKGPGEGGGDKKDKGGDGGGGDKKAKEGGGGGDKKDGGGGGQKQAQAAAPPNVPVVVEANKFEYYGPYGPYHVEMVHAPQMFSDENPNACSVM